MDSINKNIVKVEATVVGTAITDKDLEITKLKVYSNVDTNKLQVLADNKGKAGIYLWTHLESGKKNISVLQ